jgi:hypothetical protein
MADERDLTEFANASGQPNQPQPHGHSLVRPTTGLAERVFGAQPVAKERDENRIRMKLKGLAAYAGEDWFYRFPVKNNKTGTTDYISGPSIKLANNVAREFGNNITEIREVDTGDAWTFYARFTDIETGFSMERAFRQRKGQTSMRTRDADRSLDIAYQIGQSKAIRNVIVNALGIYCDYAFEEAQNSLVEKIGKDLAGWRERTVKGLARLAIAPERVERVIGRSAKDWLAPDVAQVVAMCKTIVDGMANADDVFPPIEKVEQASSAAPASPTSPQSQTEGGGGEQAKQPEAPNVTAEVSDSATTGAAKPAPAASGSESDPVRLAFGRGIQAKNKGDRRSAIPREYRDGQHDDLAAAWLAGYDGKDLPSTATTEKQS